MEYKGPENRLHDLNLDETIDMDEPNVKYQMVRTILQYLREEGYQQSCLVLEDEAAVKAEDQFAAVNRTKRLRRAILDGQWEEAENLIKSLPLAANKAFLFAIYRQQYLENIEASEYQKSLLFLNKKLKPLESVCPAKQFHDLCYLLACKNLHDSPEFRDWRGAQAERAKLAMHFEKLLEGEDISDLGSGEIERGRLKKLIKQAVAYQVLRNDYQPTHIPMHNSTLRDYLAPVLPNVCKAICKGHTANVKTIAFLGENGRYLASGSSDATVKIWSVDDPANHTDLPGHRSRVWSVNSNSTGTNLVTGSADGSILHWNLHDLEDGRVDSTLITQQDGDVYNVRYHPGNRHILSCGYNKMSSLIDVETRETVQTFAGHSLSVTEVVSNPLGNLVITASKDASVRFWDIGSGLNIRTIAQNLTEVTGMDMDPSGQKLLLSTKDNSNRLWDLRMMRQLRRFRGHQNSSKNFIRARFGPTAGCITSGSEDGVVYIWDQESGNVIQRLKGHRGTTYQAAACPTRGMMATCSDDHTVRIWYYSEPLQSLNGSLIGNDVLKK
eukprot:Clim_evm87s157 gene=Clim_evmTU87s157